MGFFKRLLGDRANRASSPQEQPRAEGELRTQEANAALQKVGEKAAKDAAGELASFARGLSFKGVQGPAERKDGALTHYLVIVGIADKTGVHSLTMNVGHVEGHAAVDLSGSAVPTALHRKVDVQTTKNLLIDLRKKDGVSA